MSSWKRLQKLKQKAILKLEEFLAEGKWQAAFLSVILLTTVALKSQHREMPGGEFLLFNQLKKGMNPLSPSLNQFSRTLISKGFRGRALSAKTG
ncbi:MULTISPECIES: hypothetical protein [unclassified Coleofasciculus]|uniref:hypothetical protein n=1 Tax=unclassified Coleofasciculus TaxID=2692782 RepID=UPI001882CB1A|nr:MULTISPECIES: hypothetical protein [unclassified Coleofasciculus]MBE9126945.1 hypothetical protein [Coleofasciculus sp. LEGE 07081]MBE9150251.1 hypothetical protein [Coleofasciculus sp. LEGE 07092]